MSKPLSEKEKIEVANYISIFKDREKLIEFVIKVMRNINQNNFLTTNSSAQNMELKKLSQIIDDFILENI